MEINNSIYTFDDLRKSYSKYIKTESDDMLIEKAYNFAAEKHKNQRRKSGDMYITHPINVAMILSNLQAGPSTIIAGLLHDTIEDTDTTREEISKLFGDEIAGLVESLTKITRLSDYKNVEFEAESHRKIFVAMAKDIRVIIIKIADRLHNMRTLQFQPPEKQKKVAKETLEVYAPLAHRLGLFNIKTELENLSLYYLENEKYLKIEQLINEKQSNAKQALDKIQGGIKQILNKAKIEFTITSRIKSIYSIYKKMYLKNKSFDKIYDILALRIITKTEVNCYEILGYIHAYYQPVLGRFKDYIAMPKPNLYQSLHTTIVTEDGQTFEIQIRTEKMDEIAESGIAAHWRYKEGSNYDPKREQTEIEEKLHWFRDFVSITNENSENKNAKEYVDTLTHDIFEANVYVFTPKGKVITLPSGSTPIDFAYRIHTDIGDNLFSAKINNIMVPISRPLNTGDIVEVKTDKKAHPTTEWLNMCKSNFAKSHIKKYLLRQNKDLMRDENIEKGKISLLDAIRERKLTTNLNELCQKKVLENFKVASSDDLFINLANKTITPQSIFDFLNIKSNVSIAENIQESINKRVVSRNTHDAVLLEDGSSALMNLASCCTPIPGDDIVGYISKGNGIKVHRCNCPNISKETSRLIDVKWNNDFVSKDTYPVDIAVECNDRNQLLVDILNKLNYHNIKVFKLNAKIHEHTKTVTISMTVMTENKSHLETIMSIIKQVNSVYDIVRIIH